VSFQVLLVFLQTTPAHDPAYDMVQTEPAAKPYYPAHHVGQQVHSCQEEPHWWPSM